MNTPNTTIPKNQILNWLYSTDRHVSLDKLGDWIEENTKGQYKIINTDSKTQIVNHPQLKKDCA